MKFYVIKSTVHKSGASEQKSHHNSTVCMKYLKNVPIVFLPPHLSKN